MTYNEAAVSETFDQLLRQAPDLDPTMDGALDNLDQYHTGGSDAVDLLIETLDLSPGMSVLDVGSGFGGPARQVARRTGARVVGIDLAQEYVEAARELTRRAGLSDLVEYRNVDIADLRPEDQFDSAVTMHVQMNVADKVVWFSHIADRLVEGARLAVWEVCQPSGSEVVWPMPWSLDGTDSFLVDGGSLLRSIESAGFSTDSWVDRTEWAGDWFDRTFADGPPAGPALPMVIYDGYTRVLNLAAALEAKSLQVWQGTFTKTV
ncbi:MAG TPA: class I SAM-dependent methyltransferase [Marmoricola sp.]|nr:class I SAM-dependent methyltransferase [Marmoricola sp.]